MINQEKLLVLIEAGTLPYLFNQERGYIAVTDEILFDCSRLSGDVINNAALRALIQIYEKQLTRLAQRLAAEYPS